MESEIGKVIRRYRKEKGLAQEEMADRLGVTAPAVNKWENGVSQPDISMLAPVARLLGITLETLLSFREDLGAEEIAAMVQEVDRRFDADSFDTVFTYVKGLLREYPACCQLLWQMAVITEARCLVGRKDGLVYEEYEEQILKWYRQALEGGEKEVCRNAAGSLFAYYMRKEDYAEAEKYLSYFSEEGMERKRKQAVIYAKTGRRDEAYRTYEEMLFTGYQMFDIVMGSLYLLAAEDGKMEEARFWAGKESGLARLFDMGEYRAECGKLDLAVREKDTVKTMQIAKVLLDSLGKIGCFTESGMYAHMKFKESSRSYLVRQRENLLRMFRDKERFAYMGENREWKELLGGLEETVKE